MTDMGITCEMKTGCRVSQKCCSNYFLWCTGAAPTAKQYPSSYAGTEQEMQPRKLSNV